MSTGENRKKLIKKRTGFDKKKILLGAGIALLVLIAGGFTSFFVVKAVGKSSLKDKAVSAAPSLVTDTEVGAGEEGIVYHDGQKYRFNEDLYTVLCIGVDTREETLSDGGEIGSGGQADAIFLLVVDDANKKMSVIAIPRDTMTEIDVYDLFGQYYNTVEAQIALQYAYGDGGMLSCEMMEKAVSNLLYQLPVNASVAINMNAIGVINDAVGGVTLTALEDLDEDYGSLHKKGQEITLMGEEARLYVQGRNEDEDFSAINRLARQKQYLLAFVNQMIQATKNNLTLPVSVYNSITDYMITDVTISEVTYLATVAINCSFSEEDFHMIAGEQAKGAVYEEYQVDDEALYDMVLEVFYIPAED